jgi:PadR family transcriptional regulator PadR
MDAPFFHNWTDQIRKGVLELTVLNDIRNRGMYGYEIERKLCKSCGLLLGKGVIYRMFKRFVRHRLVRATRMKSPDGPNRKYYQLTELGHETLAQMNAYWTAITTQAQTVSGSDT